jgi:hypothetical protein
MVPEWRGRITEVAAACPEWGGVAVMWEEIVAAFREEVPHGTGRAPRCYALIQQARAAQPPVEIQHEEESGG